MQEIGKNCQKFSDISGRQHWDLSHHDVQKLPKLKSYFRSYRVFQKKVPTFVLLISCPLKHLRKWYCTFFNSPAFAEFKNNNILILGFKLEKLLTKMYWEYNNWNGWYWGLTNLIHTFVFTFSGLTRHLKKGFYNFQHPSLCTIQKW